MKTKVANVSDFQNTYSKLVEFDGIPVALFKLQDGFFAIANACTHKGGSLSQGKVENGNVTCPFHGGKFEIKTGKVVGPPPTNNVEKFNVIVEGDEIYIVN